MSAPATNDLSPASGDDDGAYRIIALEFERGAAQLVEGRNC